MAGASTQGHPCGGRKSYAERDRELVDMAKWLRNNADGRPYSLRQVAAELAERGYVTPSGMAYSASAVASMIGLGIERHSKTRAG